MVKSSKMIAAKLKIPKERAGVARACAKAALSMLRAEVGCTNSRRRLCFHIRVLNFDWHRPDGSHGMAQDVVACAKADADRDGPELVEA